MKQCRIMCTSECSLACSYCCNKIPEIQKSFKMTTMDEMVRMKYDIYNITGGEITLVPEKLYRVCSQIREHNPKAKIYLYTNGYNLSELMEVHEFIDGINFGLHKDFAKMMNMIHYFYNDCTKLSIILSVNEDEYAKNKLVFDNPKYKNMKVKLWKLNECNRTKEDRFII